MKRLFGTGGAKSQPIITDTIIGIDSRGETFEKKIDKLDIEIAKYRNEMNKMCEGPSKNMVKQKAIRCLKQKRVFEQQLENIKNQSFNLSQAAFAIDTVKDAKTSISAMKTTKNILKKEMKGIDLSKIEELYDEMTDINEEVNELQEILGQPLGMPDIDEDELEAEFEALGAEIDFEKDSKFLDEALKIPGLPSLPNVDPGVESKSVPLDEFGLPKVPEKH